MKTPWLLSFEMMKISCKDNLYPPHTFFRSISNPSTLITRVMSTYKILTSTRVNFLYDVWKNNGTDKCKWRQYVGIGNKRTIFVDLFGRCNRDAIPHVHFLQKELLFGCHVCSFQATVWSHFSNKTQDRYYLINEFGRNWNRQLTWKSTQYCWVPWCSKWDY